MEKVKTESFVLCPKFEKSFSILGKKWNPMLSDRVLVERLKELEAEGIITKAVRCGEGNRLEYFLTEKGEDLQLAMEQIQHWAEKWVKDEECS